MPVTILLAIIYAAFISLGLPDAVVGAAWPSMYGELGADSAAAALVSMVVVVSTIAASFSAGWLLRRFGTFAVSAGSVALTALALFGYAFVPSFAWLLVLAIPLGLGGGAIDTALNAFVAVNYSSRHMNFLHASWGIGAALGPLIVGFWLSVSGQWRPAYVTIGILQAALFVVFLGSRRLWKAHDAARAAIAEGSADGTDDDASDPEALGSADGVEAGGSASLPSGAELADRPWFRMPNLAIILVGFFAYSAVEMTLGLWGATYFVTRFGLSEDLAAAGGAAFYIGITAGRVAAGVAASRMSNHGLLRAGAAVLTLGAVALFVPVPVVSLAGFALAGFGCGPIYPMMLQETARRFGTVNTERMMGIQMGLAYSGMLVAPPLTGLLLTRVSPVALPAVALVLAAAVTVSIYGVEKRLRR